MAFCKLHADDVPLDLSNGKVQHAEYHPPHVPQHYPPHVPQHYPPHVPQHYPPHVPQYYPPHVPQHYPPQFPVPYPIYAGYYGTPLLVSPSGSSLGQPTTASHCAALSVPVGPPPFLSPPESLDDLSDDPEFQAFEANALAAMAEKNGGTLVESNPRMRRCVRASATGAAYRLQRDRNNLAAKQSRDRRKRREIHKALQVSFLKKQVAALRGRLKSRLCVRCNQSCLC